MKREILNDLYGQQPIQTIVSSRSVPLSATTVLGQSRTSSSAAAAAAKTAVSAAAFAASRTELKAGAKPFRPGFEPDVSQSQVGLTVLLKQLDCVSCVLELFDVHLLAMPHCVVSF